MFTDEILAELDRIAQLTDMFQQGYQAAPLLCQVNGVGPAYLAASVLCNPSTDEDHKQRDTGVLQWCKEQIVKECLK